MSKKTTTPTRVEPTVTRATLEDTPPRALKLLLGIGTSLPIRAALEQHGFTEEDRQEGWALLHALASYKPPSSGAAAPRVDAVVRDAVVALDAWDEDGFRVVRATLERRYPAQAKMVLDGIGPSTGPAAVLGVATLLDRLAALEKSKNKDDRDASALIAARGIDADERKRLRGLVATAQSATPLAAEPPGVAARDAAEAKYLGSLAALRGWYEEWSAIARSAIKRRDRLILIGLAKRKPTRGGDGTTNPTPAAPAAPSRRVADAE